MHVHLKLQISNYFKAVHVSLEYKCCCLAYHTFYAPDLTDLMFSYIRVIVAYWFTSLTRAYDNNGRCPRQKFVLAYYSSIRIHFAYKILLEKLFKGVFLEH